jgi:type II secretory pathway component PulK
MRRQPPTSRPTTTTARARRGTILITAMWIVIVLGALLLVFARSMRAEAIASGNRMAALQAAAIERGAEQYVLSLAEQAKGDFSQISDISAEQMPVGDPNAPGYFWLIRPDPDDDQYYDFGLVDEASKVSLNAASVDELLKLPNMTVDVAAAIVDWRDDNDDVTDQGAESDYYQSLPEPYKAKNAPFETIEETLLVRGVTLDLLYGYDRNRNGVVDDIERSADGGSTMFNSGANGSRGIFPLVTVNSIESLSGGAAAATDSTTGTSTGTGGAPAGGTGSGTDGTGAAAAGSGGKVNVNGDDAAVQQALQKAIQDPNRLQQAARAAAGGKPFQNIFDFVAKAGLSNDEAKKIIDNITTASGKTVQGLMNVNTASHDALMTLPGMEEDDVQTILTKRQDAITNGNSASLAWLMDAFPMTAGTPGGAPATGTPGSAGSGSGTSGSGSTNKLVQWGGRITTNSYQYSADIIAVSSDGRAFKRVRIIVDTRETPARIVYRKDLTSDGWPLPQDVLDQLRSGNGLQTTLSSSGRTSSGTR